MVTEPPFDTTTETQSLGTQIRQHRKERKFTLAELADQCDISTSFLSQIERGQANPSVTTLYTIAQVFQLPVAAFFTVSNAVDGHETAKFQTDQSEQIAYSSRPPEPSAQVVRKDQRKMLVYPGSGIQNELLSPDLQRTIQLMRVVMPPGTDTGETPFIHDGEECGIVLQGQLETWVGDERYVLGPGDSIYHKSTIPHRSRNIGDTDVIIVVAKTPPSF